MSDHEDRVAEGKELDALRRADKAIEKRVEKMLKRQDCFHFFFDCDCAAPVRNPK